MPYATSFRSPFHGNSRICLWPEMSVEYVCPESSRSSSGGSWQAWHNINGKFSGARWLGSSRLGLAPDCGCLEGLSMFAKLCLCLTMCTLPPIIRIPLCHSTVSHNNLPSEVAATLSHLPRRSDAVTRRSGVESCQDFRLSAKVPKALALYFDALLYCTMRSQTM